MPEWLKEAIVSGVVIASVVVLVLGVYGLACIVAMIGEDKAYREFQRKVKK